MTALAPQDVAFVGPGTGVADLGRRAAIRVAGREGVVGCRLASHVPIAAYMSAAQRAHHPGRVNLVGYETSLGGP